MTHAHSPYYWMNRIFRILLGVTIPIKCGCDFFMIQFIFEKEAANLHTFILAPNTHRFSVDFIRSILELNVYFTTVTVGTCALNIYLYTRLLTAIIKSDLCLIGTYVINLF